MITIRVPSGEMVTACTPTAPCTQVVHVAVQLWFVVTPKVMCGS